MMNLPMVILRHLVTQDKKEKIQMVPGISATHLLNMNLRASISSVALLEMCHWLNLTPLLSLKPQTFLQRELLLQRELVLREVETPKVKANV